MKKRKLLAFILLTGCLVTSCGFKTNKNNVVWSKWHDNGDGTHSRHALNDITIQETDVHHFSLFKTNVEPTDVTPGKAIYSCDECGAKEERIVSPTGNYVFDQKVVSPQYLYEKCSEHSSIYYMSSKEGAYGNPDHLFEVSDIGDEYTEVDVAHSDGSQYINTGVKNTNQYTTEANYASGQSVPAEYAEVEYLKAGADQWIDTMYVIKSDKFKVSFKVGLDLNDCNALTLFGSSTSNARRYSLCIYHSNSYGEGVFLHWVGDGARLMPITYQNGLNEATYEVNSGIVSAEVNGTSYSSPYEGQASNEANIYIFGESMGNESVERANGYTLYRYTLSEGGKDVRNMIPVIRLSDNKPGLYDTVSKCFFTNKGTGEFEVGELVNRGSSRLPSAYTELDYIESTGTEYIDTGIIPNQNTGIEIKISSNSYEHNELFICGSGVDSSHQAFEIYPWPLYADWKMQFNYGTDDVFLGTVTPNALDQVTVTQKKQQVSMNVGGSMLNSEHPANTFTSPYTLTLLALHRENTIVSTANVKIYECRIWDNDELMRNFVPCRKNATSEMGLFDLISNEFFANAGTGGFQAGNEVKTSGARLPSDYKEVEYIESTGSQTIDTGVKFDMSVDACEVVNQSTVLDQNGMILASADAYATNYFWYYHYMISSHLALYVHEGGQQHLVGSVPTDLEKHKMEYHNKSYYIDGQLVGTSTDNLVETDANLFISSWGDNYFYQGKIFSCKIWKGVSKVLTRDFVPCVRRLDNKPGLYDLVTGTFFTTNGESDYFPGREVNRNSNTNSLYSELEYIKFNGTQFIDTLIQEEGTWKIDLEWTPDGTRQLIGYSGGGAEYFGVQPTGNYGIYTPSEIPAGNRDIIHYNYSNHNVTLIVNSTVVVNSNQDRAPQNSFSFGGLALNGSEISFPNTGLKLYSAEFRVGDDLIASFKPALNNSTGKAGLYNTVSDEFLGDTLGGSFEMGSIVGDIGTEIAQETENLDDIQPVALPASYHQLAYINALGYHTIETGLKGAMTIEMVAQFKNVHIAQSFGYNAEKPVFVIDRDGKYFSQTERVGGKDKIVMDIEETEQGKYKATLNGSDYFETDCDIPAGEDMKLFSSKGTGGVYGKIYSVKISQKNQVKMNLIPVKNIYLNEVGFYDLVSENFYKSTNNVEFTGGSDMNVDIDMSNINMFISRYSNEKILQKTDMSDFKVFDEHNKMIKDFVPVLRNSDGKLGFYETVEKKFYESPIGNEFTYDNKVGHIFEAEKTLVGPTHSANGEKETVCKICGRHVHEKIECTSYKVTFQIPSFVQTIKIFSEVDPSKYEESLVGYTRNANTYNYSKVNAMIYFEVVTTDNTEIVVKASNGKVKRVEGNKYRVTGIVHDCVITITKKT